MIISSAIPLASNIASCVKKVDFFLVFARVRAQQYVTLPHKYAYHCSNNVVSICSLWEGSSTVNFQKLRRNSIVHKINFDKKICKNFIAKLKVNLVVVDGAKFKITFEQITQITEMLLDSHTQPAMRQQSVGELLANCRRADNSALKRNFSPQIF